MSLDGTIESLRRAEDEPGILRTRDYLHSLIRQEAEALGGKTERIVLGGFSQGGAASLFAGLTAPSRLGGILAVSGYLPISRKFTEILAKDEGKNDVNRNTKILMTHGEADAVVAYDLGRLSAEMLKNHGFDVTVKSYK